MISNVEKHPRLALMVLLMLAAALRLYHLDTQSLWVDEIASMNGADPANSWSQVVQYSISDQPPAYFLLLHAWFKAAPYSDAGGRLLSVLIGMMGILTLYFFGKDIKDRATGLAAVAISSVSYIHILFSQEVRFYGLVFLFSAWSAWFFFRTLRTPTVRNAAVYVLSTALLMYTHYFGLVVWGAQGVLFLLSLFLRPFSWHRTLLGISSGIAAMLLVSPWIPIFLSDAQSTGFWIASEPWYFPAKYFYVYFKDYFSAIAFALLLAYFLLQQFRQYRRHKEVDTSAAVMLGWVVLCFIIPLVYSWIQTPLMHVRYTLIALPPLIMLIALAFRSLDPRQRILLLLLSVFTSIASLIYKEQYYSKPQKEDWKGLVAHVLSSSSPDDALVSRQAWYCNYYFRTQSNREAMLPDQFKPDSTIHGVWWLDAFSLSPQPDETEVQLMRNSYRAVRTDSLFRARATYYRRD